MKKEPLRASEELDGAPSHERERGDSVLSHDTLAIGSSHALSNRVGGLPVAVGDVVNGKYRVDGVLGEGGVGIVVLAQHLELDERVALKFLKGAALGDAGLVARFAREAKAAVSIKSEHVARILDVGTLGPTRIPFIVMEYLDGTDLRTAGALYGTFSPADTAEYSLHVCEALAMAHANGIIHRDIKPDNLFLTTNPQMPLMRSVKVLDFGISKAALTGSVFQRDLPLIQTVHLMGTPLYMSPEQVRMTSEADARSDIWSLGMVMYEMLLGTTAFKGATITELCAAILERPVVPIREARPDVPPGLAAAVERCLAKDPAARFQNVGELAIALLPFAPKRARSCAERAIGVLRACGQAGPEVVLESMAPPPPTEPVALELPPTAATLGSFTLQAGPSPSQRGAEERQVRRSRSSLVIAAGFLVAALIALTIRVRAPGPPPSEPSVGAAPTDPTSPALEPAATPGPSATATRLADPKIPVPAPASPTVPMAATPARTAPARVPAGTARPRSAVTRSTAKPAPAASARAAGEPDLGY